MIAAYCFKEVILLKNALQVDIVACTANSGCECGDTSQGFQTYTFNQNGQERCFTTYTPLSRQDEVLPVYFAPNCYAKDRLQGLGAKTSNSNDNKAAARYYRISMLSFDK